MANAIVTKGLTKKFGSYLANDNISVTIPEGVIYGLIGRNGAGKTTFMRMLLGLTNPTDGEYELLGKSGKDLSIALAQTGCIIETPKFYDNMSAYQNLIIRADLIGLKNAKKYIEDALKKVGLYDKRGHKVKSFSLGMKQSLGIAAAILGDPKLLILDEPTNGLDPIAIANVRKILEDLKAKGSTVLISSHILGEMEKMATCYGFILEGKLVKEISEEEVSKNKIDLEKLFIEMAGGVTNE